MCGFANKLYQLLTKLSSSVYILAIKESFFLVLTPVMVSSFFLLLFSYLPFLEHSFLLVFLRKFLNVGDLLNPLEACYASISLGVCIFISLKLARHYSLDKAGLILTALICFFLTVPYEVSLVWSLGTPLVYLGSQGIVASVISSISATFLFRLFEFKDYKSKLSRKMPSSLLGFFQIVLPCFLSVLIFWLALQIIKLVFLPFCEITHHYFFNPLLPLIDSLAGALMLAFSSSLFTFLGFCGESLVQTLAFPSLLQALASNESLHYHGLPCEHSVVKPFFDAYVNLGGVGATLPLVICMTFFSRSSHLRSVGKLSLVTGLFNINEPLLFGLPLILNPLMIIPFFLSPLVLTVLTYCAMHWGWLPRPIGIVLPATAPVFISGYFVSGSYLGSLWQSLNLLVAAVIYYPFFRLNDYFLKET